MTTPNYVEALGQININFTDVEADLSSMIWSLIGEDKKIGQIVTAQFFSFHQLLAALSSLFRYRFNDENLIEEMEKLLSAAQEICEERNRYVHSVWFAAHPNTLRRVKVRAKRKEGLRIQSQDMDAEELSQFGQKIFRFIFTIEDFRLKVDL